MGINYTVKPIIHDKDFGSYNDNQHFYEVQVAGEHIDGGKIGDYWYYTWQDALHRYLQEIEF